ncbi:twin-arginine translocation pathway signal [Anaeromyxobacter dehalogenans 2CP-1]|uniref:Twin-arginine translocation pathway signal n=1 Tax=Anaeromyxobacter dehalogenans (strain ATCC BAA-258 / DSM 21875 / 2CP-1) TaxID=455488 RepID=B8J765_ANAD2|nr:hypothetical protein [Anaeromyxobacter dehalogenans]ACL65255.1 twin-arginine translocation pathway signal [Anaeromyxobacter dehalogenans 2CP-1]
MASEGHEHEGSHIEIREREGKPELRIDGRRVAHGRLPNGMYFLDDYAFDWTDDLMELARRYVSHRRRAQQIRARSSASKEGAS